MFPSKKISEIEQGEKAGSGAKISPAFDFSEMDFVIFDGRVQKVSGLEAVKIWVQRALMTKKNKYEIYDDFGANIFDLAMGKYKSNFIEIELQREIKECLLVDSRISGVNSFKFEYVKRGVTVSFTLQTIYGSTKEVMTIG